MQITQDTLKTARATTIIGDIAWSFVKSQALASAYQLGLFEALADGPLGLDEIAKRIAIKPIACRRLLMYLSTLGLVEHEDGKFRNTELGQFCTSRASVDLGPASRISPFYHMFEYLTDALREYSPRYEQALGTTPENAFAAIYADPKGLRAFAELMDAFSIPQGRLIAECFDFTPCKCVMDVAGGPGGQAIQIGLEYPHLRGIIMDLEPVCVVARERIAANGLASRFRAVAADLITGPYPTGADVIVLGHILHDWSDETCRKILRNCAAALPAKGALLISESVLQPDFAGDNLANMKDLVMLVGNEPDARERSEPEYRSLLDAAGFETLEVIRLEAPRDLLVARKR